ncbi:MAG TPA: mercuric transport protein periplasmic component [Aliiroseovarius sp.]|nr:mercuric transport protein periplasmic component [Aliiroseovarius sp.]
MKPVSLAVALFMAATPAFAVERTVKFDVPGMYCASCPFIVQSAMGSVEGVLSVEADAETRTALVVYDDEITTLEAIEEASASAGYDAFPIEDGGEGSS